MTDEQKKLMQDKGINVNDAIARFGGNVDLYLKYFHAFPDDDTYKKFKESFKVDKLWQSRNFLVTLVGIVGNLGFTQMYEDTRDLIKTVKNGNASDALSAIERLDTNYNEIVDFIRGSGI